jgi:hypothetical protein
VMVMEEGDQKAHEQHKGKMIAWLPDQGLKALTFGNTSCRVMKASMSWGRGKKTKNARTALCLQPRSFTCCTH